MFPNITARQPLLFFFSPRPTLKQIHTNKISKPHIYIGAAHSSAHLYEGNRHCVRLRLNDSTLTLTEKMCCAPHMKASNCHTRQGQIT